MNSAAHQQDTVEPVRDAIVLAGGSGTRMLPASLYMPKETMPLIDTPLINHIFWEAIRSGVRRVHIVLSKRKITQLEGFFGSEIDDSLRRKVRPDLPNAALGINESGTEIITYIQENPGGVGDAISIASRHINGPFLVLLGDNILLREHLGPTLASPENASDASLKLVRSFEQNGVPCVGVVPVEQEVLLHAKH